jgi:hypothetical protein
MQSECNSLAINVLPGIGITKLFFKINNIDRKTMRRTDISSEKLLI